MKPKLLLYLALVLSGNYFGYLDIAECQTNLNPQSSIPDLDTTKVKAGLGDIRAQANLGIMYLKGDGVEQNYVEAGKWLRKAADQGDAQCTG